MATNIIDLVSDVDLTVFSRQVPEPVENPLSGILPDREVDGRKSKSARHTRKTSTAKYRSYGAEAPIGKRGDSITVQELTLPAISEKLPVDEDLIHRLNESGAKTDIDRLVASAYDDTETLTISIRNRTEQARGQFLTTGKITIAENGVVDEADFGLPVTHKVTAPVLWSDPTAPLVEQEQVWVKIVTRDAKVRPTKATVSERILSYMQRNEQYRAYFWQFPGSQIGPILNAGQVDQVRAQFGLPALNVYEGFVPNDSGAEVRVIADNKYVLTTDTLGETQWGTTAEALELVGKNAIDFASKDAPGITVVQYRVPDPVVTWTKAAAVVMPVAGDIQGLLVADVLSAA